ncbi:MAG: GerMN domain-containing protein [Clostridia bacterium]|nr:GerMN domain-containing protein [Clostridia bacterium]
MVVSLRRIAVMILAIALALVAASGCITSRPSNLDPTHTPHITESEQPDLTPQSSPDAAVHSLTLYIPNGQDTGFDALPSSYDGTPQGILDVLSEYAAIPQGTRALSFVMKVGGVEISPDAAAGHDASSIDTALDLSIEFSACLAGDTREAWKAIGSLVNTFLACYGIESMHVTVEGSAVVLEEHDAGTAFARVEYPLAPTPTLGLQYDIVIYFPDPNMMYFVTETTQFDGTPQGIIDALVRYGALIEGTQVLDFDETTRVLDLSEELTYTVTAAGSMGEVLIMGSIVNTFLVYYELNDITVTCDGEYVMGIYADFSGPQVFYAMGGLGTQAEVFYPDSNGEYFLRTTVNVDGTPQSLVDALISYGALGSNVRVVGFNQVTRTLDLSVEFGDAVLVADEQAERMLLGAVVNTFLTYYGFDSILLLSDGEYIESPRTVYEDPLSFYYL